MVVQQFQVKAGYMVPLLRLLADMPGGGGTKQEVLDRFWERHETSIPASDLEEVASGRGVIKWANKVAWCRQDLAALGFIDRSTRNVWRITQAGREWLAQNPNATHVDRAAGSAPGVPSGGTPARRSSAKPPRRRAPTAPAGITLEKLERIRQRMPEAEFRQDWGEQYDVMVAKRRSDPISHAADRQLAEAAKREIARIHECLEGRHPTPPRLEDIGDWVYLCMTLGLEAEAAALAGIVVERWTENRSTAEQQFQRTAHLTMKLRRRKGNQDCGFAEHQEHSIYVGVLSKMRVDPRWSADEWVPLERAYEQFSISLAQKRVVAITEIDEGALLSRIHRKVRAIHRFVRGQSKASPPASVLCDWVYLCYVLELYAEGAALWQYVNKDETDQWRFGRTRKISAACRARIG